MNVTYFNMSTPGSGSFSIPNVAWTETFVCPCGIQSRGRAIFDYIKRQHLSNKFTNIYVAEATTKWFNIFQKTFPHSIGSEFLDSNFASGSIHKTLSFNNKEIDVQHQDLTNLSFPDNTYDLVISRDIFEHIPDFKKSFQEINRVLRDKGSLIFTIPFFAHNKNTVIRAEINDGEIRHLLEPEIHLNPVNKAGSLCFQNFGWDISDYLLNEGFSSFYANLYWSPEKGHLGNPFFVFHCIK